MLLDFETIFAPTINVARSTLQQGISLWLFFFDGDCCLSWQCIDIIASCVAISAPNAQ